jgi:hypothetical protein
MPGKHQTEPGVATPSELNQASPAEVSALRDENATSLTNEQLTSAINKLIARLQSVEKKRCVPGESESFATSLSVPDRRLSPQEQVWALPLLHLMTARLGLTLPEAADQQDEQANVDE